jgi:Cu(I)/Ag(I) efflux system membrane fusion protein
MRKKFPIVIVIVIAFIAFAAGGWWLAQSEPPGQHHWIKQTDAAGKAYWTCTMHPQVHQDHPGNCPICGMPLVPKTEPAEAAAPRAAANAAAHSASVDRAILYWYDPMKPDVHFDKPGKSPFMDMPLQPKYADGADVAASDVAASIAISAPLVQTLGMRTAPVERSTAGSRLDAIGIVSIDEHRVVAVEARAAGWVEALDVRAVGDPVRRGQTIAGVYSPDLFAAQQELALAVKSGDGALVSASKQRLALLGVPETRIDALLGGKAPARRVVVVAPISGVVTELNVREGMQVSPGMPLMRIADLSRVWINVQIPEGQSAAVKAGATARVTAAALPGAAPSGIVDYVYPDLDAATRTLRARITLENPALALRPGMYANVTLGESAGGNALTVPTEAVIRTGTRTVVIVSDGGGRFHPAEVTLGRERGERTVIASGLEEGQQVVTSGQFLIDSEASLRGAYRRMTPP